MHIKLFNRAWEPLNARSFLPDPDATLSLLIRELALPVLLTVGPKSFIPLSIGPLVHAKPVFLVHQVRAGIYSAVGPFVDSLPV